MFAIRLYNGEVICYDWGMDKTIKAGQDPSQKKQENNVGNNNDNNDLGLTKEEEDLYAQLLAKKKASVDAVNNFKKKIFDDVVNGATKYQKAIEANVNTVYPSLPDGSYIDSRIKIIGGKPMSWVCVSIAGLSSNVGTFVGGKVESVISSNRTRLERPLKGNQGRKATS